MPAPVLVFIVGLIIIATIVFLTAINLFLIRFKNIPHWFRLFKEVDGDSKNIKYQFGSRNDIREIDDIFLPHYKIVDIIQGRKTVQVHLVITTDKIVSSDGRIIARGGTEHVKLIMNDTLIEMYLIRRLVKKIRVKSNDIALMQEL